MTHHRNHHPQNTLSQHRLTALPPTKLLTPPDRDQPHGTTKRTHHRQRTNRPDRPTLHLSDDKPRRATRSLAAHIPLHLVCAHAQRSTLKTVHAFGGVFVCCAVPQRPARTKRSSILLTHENTTRTHKYTLGFLRRRARTEHRKRCGTAHGARLQSSTNSRVALSCVFVPFVVVAQSPHKFYRPTQQPQTLFATVCAAAC